VTVFELGPVATLNVNTAVDLAAARLLAGHGRGVVDTAQWLRQVVAGAAPDLVSRLSMLDHSRLRIECLDDSGTVYQFRWASGYSNGPDVRIQGVLE
jgi:hypothetical protein